MPRTGHTDVRLRAHGVSELPPDLRGGHDTEIRKGGVLVTEVTQADEMGQESLPAATVSMTTNRAFSQAGGVPHSSVMAGWSDGRLYGAVFGVVAALAVAATV